MDPEQFDNLINLEELWLGKNKIENIEGVSNLKKLRRLDVQSNRLTSVENLVGLEDTLEELYLAHNGIDDEGAMKASGLMLQFKELTTLDLSKNRLTSCKPFAHMFSLNELWVSSNEIGTFEDVEPMSVLGTRDEACLKEVYMEHNPIYNDFEYRKRLKEIVPSLVQIDANVIGATGFGSVLPKRPDEIMEQMKALQEKAIQRAKNEEQAKREAQQEPAGEGNE
jgi:protein phosphatase 1 regulatory subunit 7